jgi:nitronate monooxygenase
MKTTKSSGSSRRAFIKNSVAMGIGVTAIPACTVGQDTSELAGEERGVLGTGSRKLLKQFDLEYPIFQGAQGGEALAIAITNSGAMGAVSLTWETPDDAFDLVTRVRLATKGSFYANFVLQLEPESLDSALEAGCPVVQFSWGIPTVEMVGKIRKAGAKLGIQVSSRQGAEQALSLKPDFLICQGVEAGGHVQATSQLFPTLREVLELAEDVPVVAAGGVSTGHDIRHAIKAGASGVVLGTRFMATEESDAHDIYKQNLVDAGENSTAYTICFNRYWNATHRVLRNKTFLNWEAEGCPLPGSKPGEDDIVATHADYGPVMRYDPTPATQGYDGSIDEMALYAGEGVAKINDLPQARNLITRLWQEFENSRTEP